MLSSSSNAIRVAIPGRDDAEEFRWANGVWVSEEGEPAEIDCSPDAEEIDWGAPFGHSLAGSRVSAWTEPAPFSIN